MSGNTRMGAPMPQMKPMYFIYSPEFCVKLRDSPCVVAAYAVAKNANDAKSLVLVDNFSDKVVTSILVVMIWRLKGRTAEGRSKLLLPGFPIFVLCTTLCQKSSNFLLPSHPNSTSSMSSHVVSLNYLLPPMPSSG